MTNNLTPLRVAIIGSGRVARARMREIALREDAIVVAIFSHTPARAQELIGERQDIIATDDLNALLAREDLDAVMICTLNQFHADIVGAALKAGKHVSVDYPLALNLADCERLIELSRAMKRVLHVEHIELLSPWFNVIEDNLAAIGELLSISWTNLSARQSSAADWTFNLEAGATFFAHASIISRFVKLAGAACWIDVEERLSMIPDSERYSTRLTSAQIGFNSGVVGQICDGVGLATAGFNNRLSIIGSRGIITGDEHRRVILNLPEQTIELPVTSRGLFAQDIEAFIGEIVEQRESYITLSHVQSVMRLADAAERSSRQGMRIKL